MKKKELGFASIIPTIVISMFLIITAGVWLTYDKLGNENLKNPSLNPSPNEEQINEEVISDTGSNEKIFSELEDDVRLGLQYGGIHPDLYDSIDAKLTDLEAQGFDIKRTTALREKMLRVSVGGRNAVSTANEQKSKTPVVQTQQPVVSEPTETQKKSESTKAEIASYPKSPAGWSPPSTCSGTSVTFTSSPVDISEINHIVPMGQVSSSHITPTDHGYIYNNSNMSGAISNLRSPADGYITSIGAFTNANDYRIIIWHSCTVSTIYIHAYEIAPEILSQTGSLPPGSRWEADQGPDNNRIAPIPVMAGQLIGKIRNSVDFSAHDTSKILAGFINHVFYYGEQWKIHTVDMFGYFESNLQTQLKDKSLRTVPPVGGKIDYDINGKLVGNWFREGTAGYKGNGDDCTYYECHLAIVYDNVMPNLIRIAIPNSNIDASLCNVCFDVYGIKGNSPDPVNVDTKTGPVKYELVGRQFTGNERHGVRSAVNLDDKILGVFLVEMLSDNRIKVEVFPNKTASEVAGFTSTAKIYER